jgi:RHS repeat-associated protein
MRIRSTSSPNWCGSSARRSSLWQYDAAGRPQSLTAGEQQISFGYDAAGRESFRWLGASTALTNEWDQVGRLTARRLLAVTGPEDARTSDLLQERTWTYRADGNPDSITDTTTGTRNLTLDPLGRVTAVSAATWTEQYAFDALGNLTHAADSRSPDAASAGPRELTGTLLRQAGRVTYEYDAQGRLVRTIRRTLSGNRKIWTYTYDAFDRMVRAQNPDGQRWRYTYDPLGRRTTKQRLGEDDQVLEQTRFTWDAATLVEQEHTHADEHGVTTTSWDYEPGSWTPITQDQRTYFTNAPEDVIDQQFHAIITDLVGTPTELVTPDGAIAWRRATGLWGNPLPPSSSTTAAASPAATPPTSSPAPAATTTTTTTLPTRTPDCPLRFPGQYHDPETGLDYNYRRYYDPDTARYATPDPLGLAPAPNHHGYVDNPLTWADPLGLVGAPGASGEFSRVYPGGGGVLAILDNGTLTMAIEKGAGSPPGGQMFDEVMQHFGPENVTSFAAKWVPAMPTNLDAFNANLRAGMSYEDAAAKTFTGHMVGKYGLTDVDPNVAKLQGEFGHYTNAEPVFSRPQGSTGATPCPE